MYDENRDVRADERNFAEEKNSWLDAFAEVAIEVLGEVIEAVIEAVT